MANHDDVPDGSAPEMANISEARERAASALMLLEHPNFEAIKGTGLYVTAMEQAKFILHLVQETEVCSSAAEFDVFLNLICMYADGLAETLSLLQIP